MVGMEETTATLPVCQLRGFGSGCRPDISAAFPLESGREAIAGLFALDRANMDFAMQSRAAYAICSTIMV